MYTRLKRIASGMLSAAGAGALLAGIFASTALAQDEPPPRRFEYTYGGHCSDLGRNGVQPVQEGGFISVGETRSVVDDCSDNDVYVVRTYNNGSRLWSKSYNMGGNDYALSVREVMCDPEGRGGFILTGYTENRYSECGFQRDLFLLRIDRCGEIIWSRTYGTPDWAEVGWDVTEACTDGEPDRGTSRGDFIAAGYTTYSRSGSGRDGYLLRASWADGSLIWDATYDGPEQRDDYFRAVDEAASNNPGATGDIVVAGASASYGTGSFDGWLLRVSGDDGSIGNGVQGTAAYGGSGFEEFHSVQELKYNSYRGEIVTTGTTTSYGGGRDVYVVQTTPHPCEFREDIVFGDLRNLPDEGNWIREITFDDEESQRGALIVTGYMTPPSGQGHGRADVFLQKLEAGTLRPIGGAMLYGGSGTDWGWSVAPTWSPMLAEQNPDCVTYGFIVAGQTNSPELVDAGDPQQMYLIHTDRDLRDECTEMPYDVPYDRLYNGWNCDWPEVSRLGEYCAATVEQRCQYWETRICLNYEEYCDIERCECSEGGRKQNTANPGEHDHGVLSLSSYPNPVRAGGTITLEYTLKSETGMNVAVTDMTGRVIYSNDVNAAAGAGTLGVSTEGWARGTYMVSVKVDGRSTSSRVVVTE